MTTTDSEVVREYLASLPTDVSHDAQGSREPEPNEIFTPTRHAMVLATETAIVVGGRGAGKSFWSGVLLSESCRAVAAKAYPTLSLNKVRSQVGFSGLGTRRGVDREKLDACVPADATLVQARAFWWATVLRALAIDRGERPQPPSAYLDQVKDAEDLLEDAEERHRARQTRLVLVYDAIDTVAATWARRRLLTQALLEVVWSLRAWRHVRPKVFIRPDQLDDDAMRYVELPKLRAGAVHLRWTGKDLYAMLFTRLYLSRVGAPFHALCGGAGEFDEVQVRSERWTLRRDEAAQRAAMTRLAGPYMADGPNGRKKGTTYDWPIRHLADANEEITPRSFLTLMIGAAQSSARPERTLPPEGIRIRGMRLASRVRVDQLFEEFPWIKGALAPLAGISLPADEHVVFGAWRAAHTVSVTVKDAKTQAYLAPFGDGRPSEAELAAAMCRIGVMLRRADGRLDMPDLFRVAARLLKRGGTKPE